LHITEFGESTFDYLVSMRSRAFCSYFIVWS